MTKSILFAAALMAAAAAPAASYAQGVERGAARGEAAGERAAGTVGGVIGSVVGGVVGGVNGAVDGVLGRDQRPRFRAYVVGERHPSYRYSEDVRVGAVLPGAGVSYYEAPADYGLRSYRYTVVNDHTVLVDPATNRIVEIVD